MVEGFAVGEAHCLKNHTSQRIRNAMSLVADESSDPVVHVLTGVLVRQDRSDRPSMTLTIRSNEEGNFFASTVVPYTFMFYLLDGSCTTPVSTFNYTLNRVPLQIP